MSGLSSCPPKGKAEPLMPETVKSDDVIPVHLFDDSAAARGIVLVWTFRFEDILNPQKLRDALSGLFGMDGWRRLSGRFRMQVCWSKIFLDSPLTCSSQMEALKYMFLRSSQKNARQCCSPMKNMTS
jgi:hypothetical protein